MTTFEEVIDNKTINPKLYVLTKYLLISRRQADLIGENISVLSAVILKLMPWGKLKEFSIEEYSRLSCVTSKEAENVLIQPFEKIHTFLLENDPIERAKGSDTYSEEYNKKCLEFLKSL